MKQGSTGRILSIREEASALFVCDISETTEHALAASVYDYRATGAPRCASELETAELVYFGENFDPFCADSPSIAEYLRCLESLVRSGLPLVVRSKSPLLLIASPLLRQANVEVLFLLEDAERDARKARETLSALRTLCQIGVRCSTLRGRTAKSAPSSLERALLTAACTSIGNSDLLPWFQAVAVGSEQRSAA